MTPMERAQYVLENETIFEKIYSMIGDDNAQLRDQQNYRLFLQLLSENAIPDNVVHEYVQRLTSSEGMLYEIGEVGNTSVFQRSYSALTLAAIVNADRQLLLLTAEELEQILTSALSLFSKEQDLRSYVNEYCGWAHSIAHTADLLCAIIQHPHYPVKYTAHILQGIRQNLWKGYVFQDDEEERFCNIVESLLGKDIGEDLLIEWFEQLYDYLEMVAFERGYDANWFKARTNLLAISKTMYFYLKFTNRSDKLRGIISIFIQRWLKLN
jgi:hypothetical protein